VPLGALALGAASGFTLSSLKGIKAPWPSKNISPGRVSRLKTFMGRNDTTSVAQILSLSDDDA
jgi:hypothetical protein